MSEFGEQLEYFVGFLIIFIIAVVVRVSLNKEFYGHSLPTLDLFKRLFHSNTRKKAFKQFLSIILFFFLFFGGLSIILFLKNILDG
ncbi:hypothetical protein HYV70_00025 [Candidatus Uhrbacteria bacterium]|nr:hypothetical protein [Candidatus Uhrbacteria bacterium]